MPACKSTTLCVYARPTLTTGHLYFDSIPGAACQPAKVQLCVCLCGLHTQLAHLYFDSIPGAACQSAKVQLCVRVRSLRSQLAHL
jgi:hypothetical protein